MHSCTFKIMGWSIYFLLFYFREDSSGKTYLENTQNMYVMLVSHLWTSHFIGKRKISPFCRRFFTKETILYHNIPYQGFCLMTSYWLYLMVVGGSDHSVWPCGQSVWSLNMWAGVYLLMIGFWADLVGDDFWWGAGRNPQLANYSVISGWGMVFI